MSLTHAIRHRTAVAGAVALAAAAAVSLGAAGTAAAAADAAPGFAFQFDVRGSTTLNGTDLRVPLGPSVLDAKFRTTDTSTFAGTLPVPDTTVTYLVDGQVPVSATVSFLPAGQVTGDFPNRLVKGERVYRAELTARYVLKLSDLTVDGKPASVGPNCRTVAPVVVKAATPAGGEFDLITNTGGRLVGTYAIGEVTGCGQATSAINSVLPLSGNRIALRLTNGRMS